MTWIRTIAYREAKGRLRALYERIAGPDENVDNIMLAHSLRPHSMEGHMALYKRVLHHSANRVPKWFLETIGVYTSLLNGCGYCVDHHSAGLVRLLGDPARGSALRQALLSGELRPTFDAREAAALAYARALTEDPSSLTEADIAALRAAGWDDGEILEINQVVAYFNYANRTVLGLGIDTEGDVLGLSPGGSGDEDDWRHQ
jgi:uncharacterized peroxidase-related enzyme